MVLDLETMTDPALEPEVRWAQRGFPKSQQLLAGVSRTRIARRVPTAWHDSEGHSKQGAFAVVRRGGPYEDLLGEILILTHKRHSVYVYCVATADIVRDISLARRAFHDMSHLARESIKCTVEVQA